MHSVLLAALAGLSFGALAVAVRWGLGHGAGADAGALVAAATAVIAACALAAPAAARHGIDLSRLWPFLAVGLIAPGASQVFLTLAVRDAGPSRAAIFMGTAPLLSILIALTLLGEPFHAELVGGTALIVAGGIALAGERRGDRPFHARGSALALVCAGLFAARDNLLRVGTRDRHPPPSLAAAATLLGAAAMIAAYLIVTRRVGLRDVRAAAAPFVPAGLALAGGYCALLAAYGHGRVSIVAPLNATGSLWAVVLAAIVIGRSEMIGRRVVGAGVLVVLGGALIGAQT
jgi:drug/metabolite transporter (DMT)-like permease